MEEDSAHLLNNYPETISRILFLHKSQLSFSSCIPDHWDYSITVFFFLYLGTKSHLSFSERPLQDTSQPILSLEILFSTLPHKMPFGQSLCFSLWLFGKHFSFMITWYLDGNAWIALLKLFAFSYITSASGMPESINRVYLVNYLSWNTGEREDERTSGWHGVSSWVKILKLGDSVEATSATFFSRVPQSSL